MKKEFIARLVIILFLGIAILIPVASRQFFPIFSKDKVVEIHARMPENGGWSPAIIKATDGEPIHLRLTSDDVLHSFAIGQSDQPPLDIPPGEFVDTTLIFDQPGRYTFYCTRWCGPNHWRMRGIIEVSGPVQTTIQQTEPLYQHLGLDLDAPHLAPVIPEEQPSAERGRQLVNFLPTYATDVNTYQSNSPAQLWQQLRTEANLRELSDANLRQEVAWDVVAYIWQNHTTPQKVAQGANLFSTNCAACHGETGRGDGVMVANLPAMNPQDKKHGLTRPPDFTNPQVLLGASPALLAGKIIRGGMGTGMPYWGPIFTDDQIDDLVSYIYTFVLQPPD